MPSTAPDDGSILRVAVGVIRCAEGRILMTRRAAGAHQGGLWEFPGGKVESGETLQAALARELAEELGIRVTAATPLIRVPHDYGDRRVVLETWCVDGFSGIPTALEGQPLRWVRPETLSELPMPAANRPIATAAALPDRYAITPQTGSTRQLLDALVATLDHGVRLVQWRVRALTGGSRATALHRAVALCHAHGARILENAERPSVTGVDGLHLPARVAARRVAAGRRPHGLLAVSCHDPAELAGAMRLGADFAVLSPVAATPSHPDAMPLGWSRFETWVAPCPMPVYALGGLGVDDIADARAHGAQGVAGIRGLWRGAR